MDASNIGRIAAGTAIGASAVGVGIWAAQRAANAPEPALAGPARHFGAPQPLFDGLGVAAMAGALALATVVGRGHLPGHGALVAAPAALALGAVSGTFLGRRGAESSHVLRTVAASPDGPSAPTDASPTRPTGPIAEPTIEQIREFQEAWGTDDDIVDLAFDEAAGTLLATYDHDLDDAIDIHPGQPIETDERVAEHHMSWLGGAEGPAEGDGSKVQTNLTWLVAADADEDLVVTRTEIATQLQSELDGDGDGRLEVGEGSPPPAETLGNYSDLEEWAASLSAT